MLASALVLSTACGGSEAAEDAVDTTPIVGVMELPISHRGDATAPSDALRVEISPTELRLESRPVYTLERGRVPAAEVTADGLTQLRTALQAAPARPRVALTAHGMVPYGTLVRTIQTLTAAGYRDILLAVRPVSGTGAAPTAPSWMPISSPQIAPFGPEPVDPATYGGPARGWGDFTSRWEESYDACRAAGAGQYTDCDPKASVTPEDGQMQVVLWARGRGMQVRFNRVGAPPPEPSKAPSGPALIEGVRAAPTGEGEEIPPDPSTTGAFAFRAEVATAADSAISGVTRPVCGASPCPTVVEADEETPVMRVVSLLGAAFPNGSSPPHLVLRLPAAR
ncbi:ExbD/TolR family protein [Sandaracinus amylolyticus]|uniref:ExbD/TolR family protein n=1 Tax=Sandaracinus amylolyticus TaxID=927083 RepID=UPI001F2F8E53|nr:hypothetical protein [Sandaracinus amylolyticus]UJR81566.1 Hypothetical protein I5071_36260 [Sandaracinus amylolyticus]